VVCILPSALVIEPKSDALSDEGTTVLALKKIGQLAKTAPVMLL
jgi:hypothetical protein